MTLTSELRDPNSLVRAYLDGISPLLTGVRSRSSCAHSVVQELGLAELAESAVIVRLLPEVDAALVGTAFDIRARIALDGFDARTSASAAGVVRLPTVADKVENGPHRARILAEGFSVAEALLRAASSDADLDRAAILFAYCEQLYRAGSDALSGSVGVACDSAADGQMFADNLNQLALIDIRSLMEANTSQMDSWRDRIAEGERFEPNPGTVLSTV